MPWPQCLVPLVPGAIGALWHRCQAPAVALCGLAWTQGKGTTFQDFWGSFPVVAVTLTQQLNPDN